MLSIYSIVFRFKGVNIIYGLVAELILSKACSSSSYTAVLDYLIFDVYVVCVKLAKLILYNSNQMKTSANLYRRFTNLDSVDFIQLLAFSWLHPKACIHFVAIIWLYTYMVACSWSHALGYIPLDAFTWLLSLGCIHLFAFTWLDLIGCIHLGAFTWES